MRALSATLLGVLAGLFPTVLPEVRGILPLQDWHLASPRVGHHERLRPARDLAELRCSLLPFSSSYLVVASASGLLDGS